MTAVAPVLPTRDVRRSLEHYRRLGFQVRAYRPEDGPPGYGYLHWDEVDLHLSRWDGHDPLTTASHGA